MKYLSVLFLLSGCGFSGVKYSVGDCVAFKSAELKDNKTIFKIIKAGRYNYYVEDIKEKDPRFKFDMMDGYEFAQNTYEVDCP